MAKSKVSTIPTTRKPETQGKPLPPFETLTPKLAKEVFSLVENTLDPVLTLSSVCGAAEDGVLCHVAELLNLTLSKFQDDLQKALNRMASGGAA